MLLETGWALRRSYWGHGYASGISRASPNYSFGYDYLTKHPAETLSFFDRYM